jgi:hypothetical protein
MQDQPVATAAPSTEVRFARLLRPFPTKRLADALYRIEADGTALHHELFAVLTDPPTAPETWCQRLQALTGLLMSIEEESRAARDVIRGMYDDADRAFDVAVRAVEAIMRGLREASDG